MEEPLKQPRPIERSELAGVARELRKSILSTLHEAGSGHPGGSLSVTDILTVLYFRGILRYDPENPHWPERDRLVLSKGHACPALYAVLARAGYFPPSELQGLRRFGHLLHQGSADAKVPGVEFPGGSLGQGLSGGLGMALAAHKLGNPAHVFVILGDGESQEGQVWEAIMAAPNLRAGSLTAILDYNKLQGDAAVAQTMNLEPMADKVRAFGWNAVEIDGHDYDQIEETLLEAKRRTDRPTFIVAHTIKGRGVSYMEKQVGWHGSGVPNAEQLAAALKELSR